MTISEKKNFERGIFRNLMAKSSLIDRRNVEINVRLYVESFFTSGKKINHIGIYWPLKNEVDIRSLNDKYSLALPRCDKNKKLLFCVWDDKPLTAAIIGLTGIRRYCWWDIQGKSICIDTPLNKKRNMVVIKFDE